MNKLSVKIRCNTNFPEKSDKKWRLLVGETEHLVDDVEAKCKTFTTTDVVTVNGESVTKYHMSCKAKTLEFQTKKGKTKAILK